jgi:hypothetical protein
MNATIVLSIPKSETCAASVRTLNPTDSALGVADKISIKSFREKINKSNNKIRKNNISYLLFLDTNKVIASLRNIIIGNTFNTDAIKLIRVFT